MLVPLSYSSSNGHYDATKLLLEHGADPNLIMKQDIHPFLRAVLAHNTSLCKLLLEYGLDITKRNITNSCNVALHMASGRKYLDICELLLRYNYDIETLDGRNQTALCTATMKGRYSVCKFLLERGANPNTTASTCCSRMSLLDVAKENGRMDIYDLLKRYGGNNEYSDNGWECEHYGKYDKDGDHEFYMQSYWQSGCSISIYKTGSWQRCIMCNGSGNAK